jgi:hypothetical protein
MIDWTFFAMAGLILAEIAWLMAAIKATYK